MTACTKIVNGLQGSWDLAKTGCGKIVEAHCWVGKKFTNLTNYLPNPVSSFMQKVYWSAPTMVPLLILPRFYTDFFVKPIAMMLPERTIREEFGAKTAHGYYAGIRNACLIHAVVDSALLASTQNYWLIVPIVANLYMGALAHLQANPQLEKKA